MALALVSPICLRAQFVSAPIWSTVVGVASDVPLGVDPPRTAANKDEFGLVVEDGYEAFEKVRVGVVVGLGHPNVFAVSEADALVPLFEGAAGIFFVELDGGDVRVGGIGGKNGAAVVGGCVVEEDEFEILKSLGEDGVDALAEEWRVVVVGDDDAYFRRVQEAPFRLS